MLKIRLRRMGARNRPFYRVVVSDSRRVPGSPALEELGHYDPIQTPKVLELKSERFEHWIGLGATMSPTVARLLEKGAPAVRAKKPPKVEKEAESATEAPVTASEEAAEVEAAAPEETPEESATPQAEASAEEPAAAEAAGEPDVEAAAPAAEEAEAEDPSETEEAKG